MATCAVQSIMEDLTMIDEETIRKLRELNLDDIVDILEVQQKDVDISTSSVYNKH